MTSILYGNQEQSRSQVIDFIQFSKKLNPNFKVIDVGGSAVAWTAPYRDMVVDINASIDEPSMSFDINDESKWQQLLDHVAQFGMYDFAVCTHTLEDIYNPIATLKFLPKIAKAGIITTPSIKCELSKKTESEWWTGNPNWNGYIHHRWIFDKIDGVMHIIPKLGVLEVITQQHQINYDGSENEIQFFWKDNIEYKLFMNNYLGPTVKHVFDNYMKLVLEL